MESRVPPGVPGEFRPGTDGPGMIVLYGHGDFDLSRRPYTIATVCAAVNQASGSGRPVVEVDLSDVTFIDASVIGALILCSSYATEHHCHLYAIHPSAAIARIMAATGVEAVLGPPRRETGRVGAYPAAGLFHWTAI